MRKYIKLLIFISVLAAGIVLAPLLMLIPPIGILFLFVAPLSLFLLPFVWLVYSMLKIVLESKKIKFIPIITLFAIILSFKLGFLWLAWALAFVLSIVAIFSLIKWWGRYKNIFSRFLFLIMAIILICSLLTTLNPFISVFGFFGTGKLIALNINSGNPCNACQNEKWECSQNNAEIICDDLDNIKNCYCCECIKNFKYCNDCFFFWNNSYQCSAITNKCIVGW